MTNTPKEVLADELAEALVLGTRLDISYAEARDAADEAVAALRAPSRQDDPLHALVASHIADIGDEPFVVLKDDDGWQTRTLAAHEALRQDEGVERLEQIISAWAFAHNIDGAARNDLFARLRTRPTPPADEIEAVARAIIFLRSKFPMMDEGEQTEAGAIVDKLSAIPRSSGEELREAAKPLVEIADEYTEWAGDAEGEHITLSDWDCGHRVTIGDCRRIRAALSRSGADEGGNDVVERLRELEAKATAGPWFASPYRGVVGSQVWAGEPGPATAKLILGEGDADDDDARLIVALRNNCRELCARIESLTAQLADARGEGFKEGVEAAADTKPPRSAGSPPNGKWGGQYQSGWDDAVVAYEAAIRSIADNPEGGG